KVAQARTLASLGSFARESQQLTTRAPLPKISSTGLPTLPPPSSSVSLRVFVKDTAWYRISQPELVAAGLDPPVDPGRLQLFVDGNQIPIIVDGGKGGRLGPTDSIEFFGIAIDSPFSSSRSYSLIVGKDAGLRIKSVPAASKPVQSSSFGFTTERRDR